MFIGAPLDEGKRAKLAEAVGWFNKILEGRQFAAAEHFTIADLTLLVTVSQLEAFEFELRPYKHIRQWLDRCKEHMAPFDYEELNASKAQSPPEPTLSGALNWKICWQSIKKGMGKQA